VINVCFCTTSDGHFPSPHLVTETQHFGKQSSLCHKVTYKATLLCPVDGVDICPLMKEYTLPYFSIDNVRDIYVKKSKFVKNEHARNTFQRYER
jgi:hypothetical protein